MKTIALLMLVGCTRYDYVKCDADEGCAAGSSCRFDECIPDATVDAGDVCASDAQCKEGLFCPLGIPVCSRACEGFFSDCNEGTCYPVRNRDDDRHAGVCIARECEHDAECQASDGLVTPVNAGNVCSPTGLCILGCVQGVRKADSASGVDLCISDRRFNLTHCQVVAEGLLGCAPIGSAQVGEPCAVFPVEGSAPACADYDADGHPLSCENNVCRAL